MYLRNIVSGSGPKLNEGEVVAAIPLPRSGFKRDFDKYQWGVKELQGYVTANHGHEFRDKVAGAPRMDRLTGTQATLIFGGKKIRYMLVEPRKQDPTDPKVLVVKHEENLGEGDYLDVILHKPRAVAPTTNLGELLKRKISGE